jgi:glutamate synthase domain-containing protein 3
MVMIVEEEKLIAELGAKFLSRVTVEGDVWKVNAEGLCYRELNKLLRELDGNGAEKIEIRNVYGQRYIGTDLEKKLSIDIYGTPGNDLGAFMNGQKLVVHGSGQDCTGNTMNEGQIIIHGHAGDITGYGSRGGRIFIRDDVGYRTGIHMKEYRSRKPYLVIGGTAQDFLGEYMAGGVLVVLGLTLNPDERHKAKFVGTGMHGGIIYIRGEIPPTHLGKEVKVMDVNKNDLELIQSLVKEFCGYFGIDFNEVMSKKFRKIVPFSHRPYGRVYAY